MNDNKQVMVSICCLAYNHEKYIRSALDSFLMQKTDFSFEILIHDDASTDATASIIREYEEKYPDVVMPVYQIENQYSKLDDISKVHQYPRARGKYLALCEGDDYWTEPDKLQKQFDFMEAHPEYALCVHNTRIHNCVTGEDHLLRDCPEEKDIPLLAIMERSGSQFHTSSMFFRKEDALRFPDYCSKYGFGDYPKSIFLALQGKVRYMPEAMSVYRLMTETSWTNRNFGAGFSAEKARKHAEGMKAILHEVDEDTRGRYHEEIMRIGRAQDFDMEVLCENYREAIRNYPEQLRRCPWKVQLSILCRAYCPGLRKAAKKLLKRS